MNKCHLTIWGGKSYRRFTPQIAKYDLPPPPPNRPILSKISDTQHHALLHKGLFCERPKKILRASKSTVRYKKYVKCRVRMAEPSRESHRFGIAGSRLPRSVVHNLLIHRFLCNPKAKIYPIDNKMLWRQSKRVQVTKSCL